jgi:hypothetical protein
MTTQQYCCTGKLPIAIKNHYSPPLCTNYLPDLVITGSFRKINVYPAYSANQSRTPSNSKEDLDNIEAIFMQWKGNVYKNLH